MKQKEPLEILNEVFEKYGKSISNLHSTLWSILVDKVTNGKVCCFSTNYTDHGAILGIAHANESGYQPTPSYFIKGTPYDEIQNIITDMSKLVFGIDVEAQMQIILSSMRKNYSDQKEKFMLVDLHNPGSKATKHEMLTKKEAKQHNDGYRQEHSNLRWLGEKEMEQNY